MKVCKQKNNLSKPVQKLVNLPAEGDPFERASHFIKEGQMVERGQKFRSNCNGKYILL